MKTTSINTLTNEELAIRLTNTVKGGYKTASMFDINSEDSSYNSAGNKLPVAGSYLLLRNHSQATVIEAASGVFKGEDSSVKPDMDLMALTNDGKENADFIIIDSSQSNLICSSIETDDEIDGVFLTVVQSQSRYFLVALSICMHEGCNLSYITRDWEKDYMDQLLHVVKLLKNQGENQNDR